MLDEEVARVARERRAEAVGAELNGEIVSCEKEHGRFKEAPMLQMHVLFYSAVVNASATSQTAAMMSLDLNLQFAAMKDLVPAKY
ncbi:hypothetical protein BYT27DRAFT_7259049 [Phlegmacium glaucopus]|nr:hypothetical protein BYT27DRAFT_7259049 [Phlegmacium glaucopus]